VTDKETVERVRAMITFTIGMIEEGTGEFSQDQRDDAGSIIFGFWTAQEDKRHPRTDGQLWKDIVQKLYKLED